MKKSESENDCHTAFLLELQVMLELIYIWFLACAAMDQILLRETDDFVCGNIIKPCSPILYPLWWLCSELFPHMDTDMTTLNPQRKFLHKC